jgi:hypothetical protein
VCIRAVGSMGIIRGPFSHTGIRIVASCWESCGVTREGGGIIIATRGCSNNFWSNGGISVGGGVIVSGGIGCSRDRGVYLSRVMGAGVLLLRG